MFQNQVFLKQCKAGCFTPPPPPRWQSKPTGLVLALVAAFVLFSACRGGSNPDEIIEVIDNPNEPPPVPTVAITIGGDYTGTTLTINYLERPAQASTETKSISGTITDKGVVTLPSQPPKGALIVSIQAGQDTSPHIYIGRQTGLSTISLNLNLDASGNIELRPANEGIIPIGTYAEFQLINTDDTTRAGSYIQEADLDLMGDSGLGVPDWLPIGQIVGSKIEQFKGTFDGKNKQIKHLYINKPNDSYMGLFGYVSNANFANVHIVSGSVTGKEYVGGLLGRKNTGSGDTIINCSNGATITGKKYVGGVAGQAMAGPMKGSYNTGNITGEQYVGGIVGYIYLVAGTSNYFEIIGNYNTGNVTGTTSDVGGIVGSNWHNRTHITACYNTGKIECPDNTGGIAGSFNFQTDVTACYNIGEVTGITDSYSVLGSDSGSDMITACYWKAAGSVTAGGPSATGYTEITATYFTPSTDTTATPPGSVEWGTGDGSGSGKYWKAGTTNGKSLPQLWWEK
ncbi:MAG: hypothetical protein Ta2F_09780 [Termitinemataceae bacterium]|nr:MAG: hypothetical protein Ta2F_09780 [Termitinemataceae bacterium]